MKPLLALLPALYALAGPVDAMPVGAQFANAPGGHVQLAGNTSSNSSSNTSSNSSANGSSYIHTHRWSVDSDDGRRRNRVGGTTRIERYAPSYRRYDPSRRARDSGDDD
jgi:hypothetical protein